MNKRRLFLAGVGLVFCALLTPVQADFTPENAFVRDAYTIMISHFDGTLLEEVTGLYWDFGEFDGTEATAKRVRNGTNHDGTNQRHGASIIFRFQDPAYRGGLHAVEVVDEYL